MKISIKVFLVLLVVTLFASKVMAEGGLKQPTAGAEGRWKPFSCIRSLMSGFEHCPFFYDSESITKISDNVIQVWTKTPREGEGDDLNLYQIDCKKRMFVELDYYEKGKWENAHFNPSPETSWKGVKPESFIEDLYYIICNKKDQKRKGGDN
jgi:hypothetical protein